MLLSHYRLVDVDLKVVGVGSVGTRYGVDLYLSETGDPLMRQIKEGYPSVLEKYVGTSRMSLDAKATLNGSRRPSTAASFRLSWIAPAEDGLLCCV